MGPSHAPGCVGYVVRCMCGGCGELRLCCWVSVVCVSVCGVRVDAEPEVQRSRRGAFWLSLWFI